VVGRYHRSWLAVQWDVNEYTSESGAAAGCCDGPSWRGLQGPSSWRTGTCARRSSAGCRSLEYSVYQPSASALCPRPITIIIIVIIIVSIITGCRSNTEYQYKIVLLIYKNKCCGAQQTLSHDPLQGAATWRI